MSKTNTGLVEHCKKALAEDWYYLWGAYGQYATKSYLDANIKQYPQNQKWSAYASEAVGKTRYADCYGLIKSYLWWTSDNSEPKYVATEDMNTSSAYSNATEKGSLSKIPEIPGLILWMSGHVGVYIGNGKFVEMISGVGAYEGQIKDGMVKKGSKFVVWFKDKNIIYEEDNKHKKVEEAVQVLVNNKIISTPDYWLQNYDKLLYTDVLIENMAKYIKKQ